MPICIIKYVHLRKRIVTPVENPNTFTKRIIDYIFSYGQLNNSVGDKSKSELKRDTRTALDILLTWICEWYLLHCIYSHFRCILKRYILSTRRGLIFLRKMYVMRIAISFIAEHCSRSNIAYDNNPIIHDNNTFGRDWKLGITIQSSIETRKCLYTA
jgi:hypothetical protein